MKLNRYKLLLLALLTTKKPDMSQLSNPKSNCRRVGEGEDGQELNSQKDVSFNSVRVNVNKYVEAPLETRGLFYTLTLSIKLNNY